MASNTANRGHSRSLKLDGLVLLTLVAFAAVAPNASPVAALRGETALDTEIGQTGALGYYEQLIDGAQSNETPGPAQGGNPSAATAARMGWRSSRRDLPKKRLATCDGG